MIFGSPPSVHVGQLTGLTHIRLTRGALHELLVRPKCLLTGGDMTQWLEHRNSNPKMPGLIPCRGRVMDSCVFFPLLINLCGLVASVLGLAKWNATSLHTLALCFHTEIHLFVSLGP